jgi:prolyl oligopeptidase
MKKHFTWLAAGMFLSACCNDPKAGVASNNDTIQMPKIPVSYPVTALGTVEENYHGKLIQDPYRWLEVEDSSATKDWVVAQNKVTFGYLDQIPFRKKIRARMEEVWNYPKYSAPFKESDRYFFYKNDGLQAQAVLYVQDGLKAEPRMFLDPNTLSADGTTSLSLFSVSKNGKYAAYGTSGGGSDWNEFYVMDVASGEKMKDHLKWIKFSGAAWHGDGFYYGRFAEPKSTKSLSEQNEFKKIYYHKLGDDQSKDKLVFEDKAHPLRSIYSATTEDERYLLMILQEGATNDNALKVRDLSVPNSPFVDIVTTFDHSYDVVDNVGSELLVITNDDAPRKRLVKIDPAKPGKENWKEIIPQRQEVMDGVDFIGGKLFARYLVDASTKIFIFDTEGKQLGELALPGIGTVAGLSGKKDENTAFYAFTSFTYPTTVFQYDVSTNTSTVYRKSEIKFNPDEFVTKREFFKSKDGTKVPIFIVHKKGIEMDGNNPTLLYGYGGFNINITPSFSTSNIALLENGGIYAVAVLRGGGEYGEDWHKAGMRDKKQNVFDDFIGAAEYLIAQKYTSSKKLGIYGRSNGGLLVGAAMTQRPDLFAVAIPGVGVLDMLRYHKFTIGHAWAVEYGSSDNAQQFDTLYKYSPLHNLKAGTHYPATMVTTADHDDRVVPAHSFKFAAALQAAHKGENPVLIRIETMAGHGAGKPTAMVIDEYADMWSFLFYNTNSPVK